MATVIVALAILLNHLLLWSPGSMKEIYKGKILNLSHRGANRVAPENTLAAFEAALEMEADGVELDVMLSKDGEVVVIHDYEVDRTTDGHGRVKDMTLAELKALDAGSWFGEEFAGQRIPTLQEAIDLVARRGLINIELKTESLGTDGLEAKVAQIIKDNDLYDRVIVSSFNPIAIWRIKRIEGLIGTALLYGDEVPFYLRRPWLAPLIRADALHAKHTVITEEYMRWAKRKGYRVNTRTVNDPQEMRRLLDLGVDGIITDVPDVLRKVMAEELSK